MDDLVNKMDKGQVTDLSEFVVGVGGNIFLQGSLVPVLVRPSDGQELFRRVNAR